MRAIGVAEIQQNISILSKLTEVIEVFDKRKNQKIATIYPAKKEYLVDKLAGKYRDKITKIDDIDSAKDEAMLAIMADKYATD